MPFVKAACPSCGGALEVDRSLEAAVCPFCGSAYIVEKAIQNYQIHIANAENLYANTVQVGENKADTLYASGNALIRFGEYAQALRTFRQLCGEYPQDERGWWGVIRAATKELTVLPEEESLGNLVVCCRKAVLVSADPAGLRSSFTAYLEKMRAEYESFTDRQLEEAKAELSRVQEQLAQTDKQIGIAAANRNQAREKGIEAARGRYDLAIAVMGVLLGFGVIRLINLIYGAVSAHTSLFNKWFFIDVFGMLFLFGGIQVLSEEKKKAEVKPTAHYAQIMQDCGRNAAEGEKRKAELNAVRADAQAKVDRLGKILSMKAEIESALAAVRGR